ncbi:MAG: (2Fe-2S)-binding protein [Pseudomonadota bacterium]
MSADGALPAAPRAVEAAVIGAGPAGASAAVVLAEAGCDVLVIDEAPRPGGRIWCAPPPALDGGRPSAEAAAGDSLRDPLGDRLAASRAALLADTVVWSVGRIEGAPGGAAGGAPGGAAPEDARPRFRIDVLTPEGPVAVVARSLLVAIGTTERVIPFPGWTTPGVVGLAATTQLLKNQGMAPGRRVAVAGAGPLLASVAAGVLETGAEVAAVADIAGPGDWLAALPALAREPRRAARGAARGAGWWMACLRRGVRPAFRTGVVAAEGGDRLEAVVLGPVDRAGAPVAGAPTRRVACDALAVGHGLAPATEITRLMRARHVFDRDLGGWYPRTDHQGRTTVPGLYVAGDAAGVRGAAFATLAGAGTGLAMARDLAAAGAPPPAPAREGPVWRAMSRLTRQRPAMSAAISPQTVVCRCEGVTRAEIDAAVDDGAHDINQLKHFTRCGMGPCQGRICGDVAAELLALRLADGMADIDAARRRVGQWTGRSPLRPVPLDAMIGAFTYDDIPVPDPAPL